ncbi:MAG: hypothetical protein FDX30_08505 [Chlorobium sp.]|nr:MAG: hypothetical protein FDX30_08505 [Chlorobium sp.]
MSESKTLPANASSDGIKGLAMMAPVVGVPLFVHAMGGVFLTGIGFFALSPIIAPFKKSIFKATKNMLIDTYSSLEKKVIDPVKIK